MANRTISEWIGFPVDELVGKRLHELLAFSSKIFLETHVLPLLRMQHQVHEIALDLATKDNSKLPTLAGATERLDENGTLVSIRLILLKAVDRRKYERELTVARDTAHVAISEAQEASSLREQFIAVLGHDLRNPLAAVQAGMRLLGGEDLSERGSKVVGMVNDAVNRMAGLIDNIMDFARGRLGGGLTLSRSRRPLSSMLEQVVEEIRSAHPQRIISTSFEVPGEVDADHSRLGQLFSNLMGNAITHGAADVPVRAEARVVEDHLELKTINGGDPIPAAAMERLFAPFARGEVRPSLQGLGLGLYIASQIAEAHGGTLTASSTPEETTFLFRMPLRGVA